MSVASLRFVTIKPSKITSLDCISCGCAHIFVYVFLCVLKHYFSSDISPKIIKDIDPIIMSPQWTRNIEGKKCRWKHRVTSFQPKQFPKLSFYIPISSLVTFYPFYLVHRLKFPTIATVNSCKEPNLGSKWTERDLRDIVFGQKPCTACHFERNTNALHEFTQCYLIVPWVTSQESLFMSVYA